MKSKLLKIIALVLLLAIGADAVSGLWSDNAASVVILEKEEEEQSKKGELDHPDPKDNFFHHPELLSSTAKAVVSFSTSPVFFKSAAHLSLPDIPPELV